MRNYDGTTYLQGLGEVYGIKAENLKVGDFMVFNGGSSSEIIKIEATKSGKSLYITTKWYDRGVEKENIRTLRANTIVVVKELNPVEKIKEKIEAPEKIENNQTVESIETIDNVKYNTLEKILMESLKLETRKSTNSDKIRKLDLDLECDLAYIRCKLKRKLKNINSINFYSSTNKIYTITKELFADNCKHLKEKDDLIILLRNIIIDFKYKNLPISSIKFKGMI